MALWLAQIMRRVLIAAVSMAVLLAACNGTAEGVATLEDDAGSGSGQVKDDELAVTDEEALLAFAQCMRDNGVEDFQDPSFGADGSIQFGFGGPEEGDGPFGGVPRETVQAAFQACDEHLGSLALGPGGGDFDPSEIQDNLVEFAACLREQGLDVDDPDFSSLGPGAADQTEGEDGGPVFVSPFGSNFDPTDPEVQAAIEACQEFMGGFVRRGGPGGPGGPGGGGG